VVSSNELLEKIDFEITLWGIQEMK